jgi:hypothetical protein
MENQNKNIKNKNELNKNEIMAHTLSDVFIYDGQLNDNERDKELKQNRTGLKRTE